MISCNFSLDRCKYLKKKQSSAKQITVKMFVLIWKKYVFITTWHSLNGIKNLNNLKYLNTVHSYRKYTKKFQMSEFK